MHFSKRLVASLAILVAGCSLLQNAHGNNNANPCVEDYRSNNCDGVSMTATWLEKPADIVCLPSIAATGVCWNYSASVEMYGEIVTTIYYTNCAPSVTNYAPSYTCNWTFVGGDISQAGDGCSFEICTNFTPGEYIGTINIIGDCGLSTSLVTTTKVVGVKMSAKPYIGIDATPSNGAIAVTNGMTAKIEVVPSSVTCGDVKWELRPPTCPVTFTNQSVTMIDGIAVVVEEHDAPSTSYEAETVSASLTAGDCDLSVSTNFTVVLVDVAVDGKGETAEVVPGSQRCADCENPTDTISVDVSILPTDLPTADKVVVSCTGASNFFEDAQFTIPVDTNGYPVGTFTRTFYIRVTNTCEQPKLTVTAVHKESGASDLANVGYELVDVDVDSTNRYCTAPVDESEETELIETQSPGKVIAAQTTDAVYRVKLPKYFAVNFKVNEASARSSGQVVVAYSDNLKLVWTNFEPVPNGTPIDAAAFLSKAPYFVEGYKPDLNYEGESWITFKKVGCEIEDKVVLTSLSIGKPHAIDNDSRLSAGTKKILKTDILPAQPMPHALVWWTSNRFDLDRNHKVVASIAPLADDTAELRIGEKSGSGIIRIYVARLGTDSNCIYSYADAYVGCQGCVESCGRASQVVDVDELAFASADPDSTHVSSFAPGDGSHPVLQSLDGYSLGMTSGGSAGLIAVVTETDGRCLTAVCSLSKDVTEIDETVALGGQTIATYSGASVSFASGKSFAVGVGAAGAYSWSEIEGTSVLRRVVHTPTATGWDTTEGSDATVLTRAAQDITIIATNMYRYTITQKNADGTVCGKTASIRTLFPWGESVTQDIVDPDGAALTTEYSYQSDTNLPGYGLVRKIVYADGSWQKYEYDTAGRVTNALSPWLDEPVTADASAVKRTVTSYEFVAPEELAGAAIDTNAPRSVIEFIAGVEVGRTYSAHYLDSSGMEVRVNQRCTTIGAAFNAASNLTTVTVSYPSTAASGLAGRTAWVRHSDGRFDTYGYEVGVFATNVDPAASVFTPNATGIYRRASVTHGLVTSPAGIANKTTQERTILDDRGMTLLSEQYVCTADGYDRISWTAYSRDDQGRVEKTRQADGTLLESFWNCCNKWKDVDEAGNETLYYYDEIKRPIASVRSGISNATFFDGCGRLIRQTQSAGGISLTTSNTYDWAGRLIATYDAARLPTLTGFGAGGRVTTNITPARGLEITETYLDGRVKAVTGSGVTPRFYTYGVYPDGLRWAKIHIGTAVSPRWNRTVIDQVGRTLRSERPGFGGAVITNEHFYDVVGRRWRSIAPDGVPVLWEVNELGETVRQGSDVNGNGKLELASNDRITASTSRYVKISGDWWAESASSIFPEEGNETPTTVSRSLRRLTGLGREAPAGVDGVVTAEQVTYDIRGNGTTNLTCINRATRTTRLLSIVPNSTNPAMNETEAGRLTRQLSATGLVITNGYDDLGRLITQTDPRRGLSWMHYDSRGYVDAVIDAASNRTSFGYDFAGRRSVVTNALGHPIYAQFDMQGRLTNTWGGTYPVSYSYDIFGRTAVLTTYRQAGGTGDETRWLRDEESGLLTNKVYADGKGPTYGYSPAGRMLSRVWARGVTTTYKYDAFGAVTNISYSDSTPPISFSFDRLGRLRTITDGTGARGFTYNQYLELESETNLLGTITRGYDRLGRPSSVQSGPDYGVGYMYDIHGRLSTVTATLASTSFVAKYEYLLNSDLIERITNSLGLDTKYYYEANRNNKASVTNQHNSGVVISSFDYAYDALARRTNLIVSGSTVNSFDYNAKNELIDATYGAIQQNYCYDDIGNRLALSSDAEMKAYGVNELNQYTAITSTISATRGLLYDDDGNLIDDSRFTYKWDAENRLVGVRPKYHLNSYDVHKYAYDYMSRRVTKQSDHIAAGQIVGGSTNAFDYDGWNLIRESPSSRQTSLGTNLYVWGLDLSMNLQGTGGAGGLLAESRGGDLLAAAYDANGNLTELVNSEGTCPVQYRFDAFGNLADERDDLDYRNPYRFATKYSDNETSLLYYGYRYYSPGLGRWLNRDPVGEVGGLNLGTYVLNNPVDWIDMYGMAVAPCCGPDVTDYVKRTLDAVTSAFDGWNAVEKKSACAELVNPISGSKAWDINPLAKLGQVAKDVTEPLGFDFASPPSRQGVGIGCRDSVAFNGKCYHSRDVNYLLWGKANSLCRGAFPKGLSKAEIAAFMNKEKLLEFVESKRKAGNKDPIYDQLEDLLNTPVVGDGLVYAAQSLYGDTFSLNSTVGLVIVWKNIMYGGTHVEGAAYFTHLGYSGKAPELGTEMVSIPEAAKALARLLGKEAVGANYVDPENKKCPVQKDNRVSPSEPCSWIWRPHHMD